MLNPLDPSQRSHSTFELYSAKYRHDAEFVQETRRFQEEKRNYLLKNASTDEDEWRSAIKQRLEQELDRRVREALETPPLSFNRDDSDDGITYTSRQKRNNNDDLTQRSNMEGMTTKEREYARSKEWKIIQAQRKLQRFMDSQKAGNGHTGNSDYEMSSELFSHGSGARGQEITGAFSHLHGNVKCHKHYSYVAEKAERDLGSLSTVERFEFFYAFTKSGFREAMKLGRLPDGSDLKRTSCGKYKDRYGIIRDEHGPYWPPDNGPLFAPPSLIRNTPIKPEPVLEHPNDRFRQTVETQQHKYNQKWRGTQVVFDSEKSGRIYEPPPVSEGNAPSLVFESRFESGNLRQARRIGQFEYELVLKTDLYTQRHTQWYYFQVKRPLPGVTYKFKIVNLLKKTSLYNHGMRPLMYSDRDAKVKKLGWVRSGHHIAYYKNEHNLQCPLLLRDRTHYVLEWQMEFENNNDTYYLAHCYPYTYTDLKDDLDRLLGDPARAKVMKREVMCETRAGNSCFLLTVSNFDHEMGGALSEKRGIVVTARVHPGETNSSWMMKGLLDYITSDSPAAQTLRNQFIFKIVPMLNPDGVIVGNYRCSLAARDLNRNYRHPRKESFPTIWHTKAMLEQLSEQCRVMIYCDLHGHSRKQNVFMYGCNTGDPKQTAIHTVMFNPTQNFLKERLFPWLMAMKAPDKFSFRGCKFAVRKCKEATGRVVMFKQMKIANSFTMEATFCGTNICRGDKRHFNSVDFEQMGKTFCEVALEYRQMQQNKSREAEILLDLTRAVAQQVLEARGLIPQGLPDPATERGRMELEAVGVSKSLKPSEQYAQALLQLLKQNCEGFTPRSRPDDSKGVNVDTLYHMLNSSNMEGCFQALEDMDLNDNEIDSNSSSDSDSESEPEMVYVEPKQRRKKKKHKKKSQSEHGSAAQDRKKKQKQKELDQEQQRPKSISPLPSIGDCEPYKSEPDLSKKRQTTNAASRIAVKQIAKNYPGFVNKYVGRSNNGIPCFSQERQMERAAKRMEEMKKRLEEEQRESIYFQSEFNMDPLGNQYQHRDHAQYPPRGVTSYDFHNAMDRSGVHIRTGYTHGDSPTRRSSASSDGESDDDIIPNNPGANYNNPYQQHSGGNRGNFAAAPGQSFTQPTFTSHFQQQQGINVLPTKVTRLPPLANSFKRQPTGLHEMNATAMNQPSNIPQPLSNAISHRALTETSRDQIENKRTLPEKNRRPLSENLQQQSTSKSSRKNSDKNNSRSEKFQKLSTETSRKLPETTRGPIIDNDSCSIPLRHTNTNGMSVVNVTPRDKHAAPIINHSFPAAVHRNKTSITFPKINSLNNALPGSKVVTRKQGERHATCE